MNLDHWDAQIYRDEEFGYPVDVSHCFFFDFKAAILLKINLDIFNASSLFKLAVLRCLEVEQKLDLGNSHLSGWKFGIPGRGRLL